MKSTGTGVILILAYPEEFVSMIPAWYRKPLEWIGMVNDGKIAAGHAAMALIDKRNGYIHYGDFGRYITPFGHGRARMANTDPDVLFEDYTVEFDENNRIKDVHALLEHVYLHPERTHGGDVMYASVNQEVDFDACYEFMYELNQRGSIIYNPFGKGYSNCSRFVFDALLAGMQDEKLKKRLKRKSPLTASPLGNVFFGTRETAYKYDPSGGYEVYKKSLMVVLRHLFAKPPKNMISQDNKVVIDTSSFYFLDGTGDQAYHEVLTATDNFIEVRKYNADLTVGYERKYRNDANINLAESFALVHDCNASWITVEQNNQRYRLEAI